MKGAERISAAFLAVGIISILVGSTARVQAATRGLLTGSSAGHAPRIVSAAMRDGDHDSRADGVRLDYSVRIRHAADRDGRYPFTVAGYRIRAIGAASGKSLLVALVERKQPDSSARPVIRYRQTHSQPVLAQNGTQAETQVFRRTKPASSPLPQPPTTTTTVTTTTTTTTPTSPADSDGDGVPDANDCGPKDGSIHPGAPDAPDIGFVDSNCDGIDGDAAKSIFVAPTGQDTNSGIRDKPKRTVAAAVLAADERAVLVAAGSYNEGSGVELRDNVGIYGGYAAGSWSRSNSNTTVISGSPQAVIADGDTGVTLQLLRLRANAAPFAGASPYAIRAINNSKVKVERAVVQAGDGRAGSAGANGTTGADGLPGRDGEAGDDLRPGGGGAGGAGARAGGRGGDGGRDADQDGNPGEPGAGAAGGAGGAGGKSGRNPTKGLSGNSGGDGTVVGVRGTGGTSAADLAGATWRGHDGTPGGTGEPGSGGGGGGGGGFRVSGIGRLDLSGGGGGGGGGGGAGGGGGGGGQAGGGSFGVYLIDSAVTLSSGTVVRAGAGGAGGNGGSGGFPGRGGAGGGATRNDFFPLTPTGGPGDAGGNGARGGPGGSGAGGPSIGIFKAGASKLALGSDVTIAPGAAGKGGSGGVPGQDGISTKVFPSK